MKIVITQAHGSANVGVNGKIYRINNGQEFTVPDDAFLEALNNAGVEYVILDSDKRRMSVDRTQFLASASPGATIANLYSPFDASTFETVGAVPSQLVLSGNKIVVGLGPATAGNTYSVKIRATSPDGKSEAAETFTFGAVAPDVGNDPIFSFDLMTNSGTSYGQATTAAANFSTTSTGVKWTTDASGAFVQHADGALRLTSRGLRIDPTNDQLLDYSNDMTNAAWSVSNGAVKTTLSGTRGPFNRVSVASAGNIAARLGNTQPGSLVAGQPYRVTFYFEDGETNPSGKVELRVQQGFGGFQPTTIVSKMADGYIGVTGGGAGAASDPSLRQLANGVWRASFTFTPGADGAHGFYLGPHSATSGETIVALGCFVQPKFHTSPAVVGASAITTPADNITAIGPLAAALEADTGTVVVEVDGLHNVQGDILSGGVGDAVKLFYATSPDSIASKVSGKTLPLYSKDSTDLGGVNTLTYEWSPSGGRLTWNSGIAATTTVPLPAHNGMHFLAGVPGYLRKVKVYNKVLSQPAALPVALGWRDNRAAGGGGGYITGIITHPVTGVQWGRCDVYGLYRRRPGGLWEQVVTADSIPNPTMSMSEGVSEVCFSISNPLFVAMFFMGLVWISEDEGAHWTQTAYPFTDDMHPNRTERLGGPYMAIDPANPNVMIVTTPSTCRMTTDKCATWTDINLGGAADTTGFHVCYDPSSAVIGTGPAARTQGVYIFRGGTGCYYSSDGAGSFTLTAGSPTTCRNMIVTAAGTVWAAAGANNSLVHRRLAGTWSSPNVNSGANRIISAVAVDPTNPNRIVAMGQLGYLSISADNGDAWSGFGTYLLHYSPNIGWWNYTNETFFATGNCSFDSDGFLHCSEGIGVWKTKPGSIDNQTVIWVESAGGIDNMVCGDYLSIEGGGNYSSIWDRNVMRNYDVEKHSRKHGITNVTAIVHGWRMSYAPEDPNFVFVLANTTTPIAAADAGYTGDDGDSWVRYAVQPTDFAAGKVGGDILALSKDIQLVACSENGPLIRTANRGGAWAAVTIPGVAAGAETGWGNSKNNKRLNLIRDPQNPAICWAYNNGGTNAQAGLYESTDWGANFAIVFTGQIAAGKGDHKIKTRPDKAIMYWAAGRANTNGTPFQPSTGAGALWRSDDRGRSWNPHPDLSDVYDFDWGAKFPGSDVYPFYVRAYYKGVFGTWMSLDDGKTFKPYNNNVGNNCWIGRSLDFAARVVADRTTPGRLHAGMQGSSWKVSDLLAAA